MPSPIQYALALKEDIKSLVQPAFENSVGAFVAEPTNNVPRYLRPAQAIYRRVCDIYAATGAIGQNSGLDVFYDPICNGYLGAQYPEFVPEDGAFLGGQCAVLYDITCDSNVEAYTSLADAQAGTNINHTYTVQWGAQLLGPIEQVYDSQFGINGPNTSSTNVLGEVRVTSGQGDVGIGKSGSTGALPGNYYRKHVSIGNVVVTRTDGMPDDCGDPRITGDFQPVLPGPPPPPNFRYYDGDQPSIDVEIGTPTVDEEGNCSIPVTIDGELYHLAAGIACGNLETYAPNRTDFDNPIGPVTPGTGGNPPDGIDSDNTVSCVVVSITLEPPNRSIEVGGPESIFIPEPKWDPGWFRWKGQAGNEKEIRLTSRSQQFCYCCGGDRESSGYEVKFSPGFSGFVTEYYLE